MQNCSAGAAGRAQGTEQPLPCRLPSQRMCRCLVPQLVARRQGDKQRQQPAAHPALRQHPQPRAWPARGQLCVDGALEGSTLKLRVAQLLHSARRVHDTARFLLSHL